MKNSIMVLLLLAGLQAGVFAVEKKVLYDFESEKNLAEWTVTKNGKLEISAENATSGKNALKVTLPVAEFPGISLNIPKGKYLDWNKFDYLKIDFYSENEDGLNFEVRIDDDLSQSEEPEDQYSTWSSSQKSIQAGKQTVEVDLTLLNSNDKSRQINLNKIKKVIIFMTGNTTKTAQTFFIDNIRLEKD